MLTEIDNSKQRIRTLQNHLKDEQFTQLSDTILKTLGVVDQEGTIN
jgi:hypothetical protein